MPCPHAASLLLRNLERIRKRKPSFRRAINCPQGQFASRLAAGLGFEPRKADSESAVIPFHHPAIWEYFITSPSGAPPPPGNAKIKSTGRPPCSEIATTPPSAWSVPSRSTGDA